MVETNCYCHDYIDILDNGPSPEPDVTEADMFMFLALTIQMGHGVRDKLTDYRATVDQLYTPFYGTMMKRDRYLHILRYLHFTDNRNEPDRTVHARDKFIEFTCVICLYVNVIYL